MKTNIGKIILFIALFSVIGIAVWYIRTNEKDESGESYIPSEAFQPAWNAMKVKVSKYDIEETVKAMNALEIAQCQSEDFMSYLEYVAKQDFSRVSTEVLEQKKKLFPILQHFKITLSFEGGKPFVKSVEIL